MNLTSRRADEFNRLLETGTRTDDPVDAPMLALAQALQDVPTVAGPTPEFRQALRQRLVAVATVQGVGAVEASPLARARAAGSTWRFQRRVAAIATGAAMATSVSGMALAASRSVPGDPFYGVKRATENVQLALTTGTEARGKRHLEFARTRLGEVADLAGGSSADAGDIIATLHDMDVQTRDGANDLLAAFQSSRDVEPLQALSTFSSEQFAALRQLLPQLPADAQASARASLALLSVVATRTIENARSTPSGGAPVPTTPVPSSAPAPAPAPGTTSAPASTTSAPASSQPTSGTQTSQPLPTSAPLPTATLPTSLLPPITTSTGPLPGIATIPPLPDTSTPLPTVLPTLGDLPLPGLGG